MKSSYSDDVGGACVEASAAEGFAFKKSSYSDGSGHLCVEIGTSAQSDALLMRDSKFESGSPLLETSPEAFTAFVGAMALEDLAHVAQS